jgi:hypothetical protein
MTGSVEAAGVGIGVGEGTVVGVRLGAGDVGEAVEDGVIGGVRGARVAVTTYRVSEGEGPAG